jgi:hypothetical protein
MAGPLGFERALWRLKFDAHTYIFNDGKIGLVAKKFMLKARSRQGHET